MPAFQFDRVLPFPPGPIFDLVADVERYPEFLPGWRSARILRRDGNTLTVQQELGTGAWSWQFRTRAVLERPTRITITTHESPFSHLEEIWTFVELADGETRASLSVDYALRSPILRRLATKLFDEGFSRTLSAFEQRAYAVLGASHRA